MFSKELFNGDYILPVSALWFSSVSEQSVTLGRWMGYRWGRNVWKRSRPVRHGLK